MKMKLKKMLLINWLYYEKVKLDFDDIVFLSGKTGEGKSALIDAMQIVILGKTDKSLFNKSANDKTTRDLMGYLKGKYKNGTYKRDKGFFSSHLCMQFEDEKGQTYCFGIVFDCEGATRNEMDYRFYMMNHPIPEHEFVESDGLLDHEKRVYDIRRMKKFLDSFSDRGCRMFTTNTDYRNYFKQRMMIKDERFFDVFKMAVAYTPMMNISEFIVKNICQEEEDLNLEEMQEEIQDYRQMKEQLETVQSKKEQLQIIHDKYMDILQDKERFDTLAIEQQAINYQMMVLEHEQVVASYHQHNEEFQTLKQQRAQSAAEYEAVEKQLEELKDKRKDNAADILERKIQNCQNQWDIHHEDVSVVSEQLIQKGKDLDEQLETLEDIEDEELLALEEGISSTQRLMVRKSINQVEHLERFDLDEYKTLYENLQNIDEHVVNCRSNLKNALVKQQEEMKELLVKKQKLENGKKPYPKQLLLFKEELQKRLSMLHQKEISVTILADHITIKDETWRNAIEGYIRNQKLNLIVGEAYFMDAYRMYRSMKNELDIHTYSIVDQAKAKPGPDLDTTTLYDHVEVDREDLKPYVKYLLGRVACCEKEADIRKYHTSITPDCMLYSGYAVSHMNPNHYKIPFIGADSLEKQLIEVEREIKENQQHEAQLQQLYDIVKDIHIAHVINDDFIRQVEAAMTKAEQMNALEKEMKELKDAMTPQSLQELMDIDEQIKATQKERNRIYGIQVEQGSNAKQLEKEITSDNKRMQELEERLKQSEKPVYGIPDSIANIKELDKMIQRKQQIDSQYKHLENSLGIDQMELKSQKEQYNLMFRIHLDPSFASEDYEREYEKFAQNVVEGYIEKCHLAEQKAYECFQNNFFNALNSKIENVKMQIDRLNRSIKRHQFGRSQYEFVCTCNEDYREYYNLITNKELNGHNLLNTHVYEENEELIRELFDKISALSSLNDPKAYHELEKEVKMLSRFTTYLKFDILENGNSLGKTIGSSSGGETQTPFYVAVLVSLFSVYDGPAGGLQLAVFDEAFDKMDNERIEECINLLKSLGFQAIIVTPTDKISNLSRVADMTLIATSDERNHQRVSTVTKWTQKEAIHEQASEAIIG